VLPGPLRFLVPFFVDRLTQAGSRSRLPWLFVPVADRREACGVGER